MFSINQLPNADKGGEGVKNGKHFSNVIYGSPQKEGRSPRQIRNGVGWREEAKMHVLLRPPRRAVSCGLNRAVPQDSNSK